MIKLRVAQRCNTPTQNYNTGTQIHNTRTQSEIHKLNANSNTQAQNPIRKRKFKYWNAIRIHKRKFIYTNANYKIKYTNDSVSADSHEPISNLLPNLIPSCFNAIGV